MTTKSETGTYQKYNGLEVSIGNFKLGTDTLIFNMGSASGCPSKRKGLCKIKDCYALTPEMRYPGCLPFRNRQEDYWKTSTIEKIRADFDYILQKRGTKGKKFQEVIKYFRYNESGDFWTQSCIDKLDQLAYHLKCRYGIVTYGYSARIDLDFSKVQSFKVKGSGYAKLSKHGKTIARELNLDKYGKAFQKTGTLIMSIDKVKFHVCPGNCRKCNLCKVGNKNIVFQIHKG